MVKSVQGSRFVEDWDRTEMAAYDELPHATACRDVHDDRLAAMAITTSKLVRFAL